MSPPAHKRRFRAWAFGLCLAAVALFTGPAGAGTSRVAHPQLLDLLRGKGGGSHIYVMNADGTGRKSLTAGPADDFSPTWSPDRSKIAFATDRDGDYEIYVMNADGTGLMNLTNDPAADDYYPAWSPDGTKIAFTRYDGSQAEIYVMNADGSGQTNITNDPADDFSASWSPDGLRLAFVSERGGSGDYEIFVMKADGSGQTNVTNDPSDDDYYPAWSPDGAHIAFTRVPFFTRAPRFVRPLGGGGDAEIYVMNPDGSGQTNLTNDPGDDYEP